MTHSMKSRSAHTSEQNRTHASCSAQTPSSMHTSYASTISISCLGVSAFMSLLGFIVLPSTIIIL